MGFSWEHFDEEFLNAIIYSSETPKDYRPIIKTEELDDLICSMNLICRNPNLPFVKKYRSIIEDKLLRKYPDVLGKVFELLNVESKKPTEKFHTLKTMPSSKNLLNCYVTAIFDIGGIDVIYSENSKFHWKVDINIKSTPAEDVDLYDFQEEAVNKLNRHFIKNDNQRGLLVMPTGSGKSRTTTYFLIKDMISRGYQVLWIAHRHMLIDQAANCFYKYCGLSKIENPDIKRYSISCISSKHQSIKSVDKNSTVIVAGIRSLCLNLKHLRRITSKKLIVVIDEAHHTFARSYGETLKYILKYRPDAKILGLTATPVRNNENNTKVLLNLFDNNIVYDIPLSKLIRDGILSDPVFERINTDADFEPVITDDEAAKINRNGELPESLLTKIASCHARNNVIVNTYLDNAKLYGKTLIFALNILHSRFLKEELKKKGINCDCVYSGKEDNQYIIEKFKNGDIDVLINVNILTEGSDVPDINTVFLTRPTQSEGLLMQMIGRGMRGVKSGGTEKVNIVDFYDKWHIFNRWLNPQWLLSDEDVQVVNEPVVDKKKITIEEKIPWVKCKYVYSQLSAKYSGYDKLISLPSGYYSLIDKDGYDYTLLVFEDQLSGYVKLIDNKEKMLSQKKLNITEIIDKYFNSFCMKPNEKDIETLLYNYKNFDEKPQIKPFVDRKKIDPYYVAERAFNEGLDVFELAKDLYNKFESVEDMFGSLENYQTKVSQAYIYRGKKHVYGLRVEELAETEIPFDRTPVYDIDELVQEVKDEMFNGTYDGISSIKWTNKAYKTYYGCYFYKDNSIVINCILNSKDVNREVVKFVIYHEMLHRDYVNHDKHFRAKEHLYKNYEDCEYFLYGHMTQFEIEEW